MPLLLVFIFTLFVPRETQSANILFFNGRGEGSHYFAAAGIAEELVNQGHSVTFLLGESYMGRSQHPVHPKLFNFISCNFSGEEFHGYLEDMSKVVFEGRNFFFESELIWRGVDIEVRFCENVFQPSMLKNLRDSQFDLIIFDPIWPCAAGLSQYLQGKKIAFCPTALIPSYLRAVGNPINPATTAEVGFGLPVKMNFMQRVQNLLLLLFGLTLDFLFSDAPYGHIFEHLNIKPFTSFLRDVDLTIVASVPLVDKTFSTMPGVVIAAGLTAVPPSHLPEDLEIFMQSSGEHGVILFSLGSYVTHLPEDLWNFFRRRLLRAQQNEAFDLPRGKQRTL